MSPVCSQGMPTEVGGWKKAMGGEGVWGRRFVGSMEMGGGGREAAAGGLLAELGMGLRD